MTTIVSLLSEEFPNVRAIVPPSYSYNVRFPVEGKNYKKIVPISHAVGVGTTDRLLFCIAADKSSLHDFDLVLRYNNSEQIQSETIELELFRSKLDPLL
ncbi:hypothetical protein [Chroococcidiopsis sp. SAG 2025]|uniref:hypothetical protein n=1 Tax=Chroococcidiopsis sp. SAG 2025 TaxID=171389 RepID=UPI0029372E06|nr:hypothetical protein [Chroococcidiopsis sp. SAG 2025]